MSNNNWNNILTLILTENDGWGKYVVSQNQEIAVLCPKYHHDLYKLWFWKPVSFKNTNLNSTSKLVKYTSESLRLHAHGSHIAKAGIYLYIFKHLVIILFIKYNPMHPTRQQKSLNLSDINGKETVRSTFPLSCEYLFVFLSTIYKIYFLNSFSHYF